MSPLRVTLIRTGLLGAIALSSAGTAAAQTPGTAVAGSRVRALRGCRWHPECSTAGGRLEVREIGREPLDSGTVVSYGVSASGLPAGRTVDLHIWGGEQGARVSSGYLVDSTGRPACPAGSPRSPLTPGGCLRFDSLRIRVGPVYAGSPVLFALLSSDDSVRVFARAVPFPVFAADGRCRVDVVMLSRREVRVIGTGFSPGERVVGVSVSGGTMLVDTLAADDSGTVPAADHALTLALGGAGKTGGHATYRLGAAHCRTAVSYLWGDRIQPQ